jgi:hypothetical protein
MRKPAFVIAGLAILLVGYITAVSYELIPFWLIICLSPFTFVIAVIVFVALGLYTILLVTFAAGFAVRVKEMFLLKYGTETQASIVKSELYHGPGLHMYDPCFKGQFSFIDQQGRRYSYKFSRECYDSYDLASSGISINDYYQRGIKRRLIYWKWIPSIHHLYGPDINIPSLRGRFGLYRME